MLSRTAHTAFKVPPRPFTPIRFPSLLFRPSTSGATTTHQTSAEEYEILRSQRRNRPLAPHLTIYQPQLTWMMSAANRITGVTLSAAIYAYLAACAVGLPVDTATVAAVFGGLPSAVKVLAKAGIAAPFMYHSWNGLRHLTWDQAKELQLKSVYRTGYAVLAVTVVTSLWAVSV